VRSYYLKVARQMLVMPVLTGFLATD